jgi:hypothetical protein
MKRLVLRDFLSLMEGDIIDFRIGDVNTILVSVGNRKRDVPFYGNDKGKWSKDNPPPSKSYGNNIPNVHFQWAKESIAEFTAMEFRMPECPKDLTKHLTLLYTQYEWREVCMQKVIEDLENQGVI